MKKLRPEMASAIFLAAIFVVDLGGAKLGNDYIKRHAGRRLWLTMPWSIGWGLLTGWAGMRAWKKYCTTAAREAEAAFNRAMGEFDASMDNMRNGRPLQYRLIGQTPVPCGMAERLRARQEEEQHRVRLTRVGPYEVSTIFLGLDVSFHGPPLLFETMTFVASNVNHSDTDVDAGDAGDGCERYTTWAEAEAGHERIVQWVKTNFCAPGEEPVDLPIPAEPDHRSWYSLRKILKRLR